MAGAGLSAPPGPVSLKAPVHFPMIQGGSWAMVHEIIGSILYE